MTEFQLKLLHSAQANLLDIIKCGCMDEPEGEGMDEEHKASILAASGDLSELIKVSS